MHDSGVSFIRRLMNVYYVIMWFLIPRLSIYAMIRGLLVIFPIKTADVTSIYSTDEKDN